VRVFLTGATGFIGSHLVPELIGAGHDVVGLARSDAGANMLARAEADVFRGDVNDLRRLRCAADAADGVIHAAPSRGAKSERRSPSAGDKAFQRIRGPVVVHLLGRMLAEEGGG
jgi:nucleoside-diphosphate-sugar epimerase